MRLKNNLDEILYDRIVESLLRGDYKMGQKLTLDELAEKFEVSRTPVVQAVKLLSNDGILRSMSNGRIYVPEYQPETVRQICEVRQLMEGYALDTFLDGRGLPAEQVVPQLERCAAQCNALGSEDKFVEMATADRKFHRTLVESAGNDVLTDIYARIQGRFIVANYLLRPMRGWNFQATVDGHAALLEAVRRGDRAAAQAELKKHIDLLMAYAERA